MSIAPFNKKNIFFHFYIKISGKDYVVSTLKLNLHSNQIYYRFYYPSFDFQEEIISLHHISFHTNQTSIKTNTDVILDKINTFSLPLEGESKILLFQSFLSDIYGHHLLQENINFSPEWKNSLGLNQEILIADLVEPVNFSLILVIVPNDYKNILELIEGCSITDKNNLEIKLSSLRHPEFKSGMIEAFEKHSILVFPTPYVHDSSKYKDEPSWKIFHPIFPNSRLNMHFLKN